MTKQVSVEAAAKRLRHEITITGDLNSLLVQDIETLCSFVESRATLPSAGDGKDSERCETCGEPPGTNRLCWWCCNSPRPSPPPPQPAVEWTALKGDEAGRELGGKLVRDLWIEWAREQPNPKPSWLIPWSELPEPDKEADRQIYEGITKPLVAETKFLKRSLASSRARIEVLEEESRNVPLCGDHAMTWFTARYFKPGDCWFCQYAAREADLTAALSDAREWIGTDGSSDPRIPAVIQQIDSLLKPASALTATSK